jgi:phosphoenolpyruvate carboxykinase (GTP)
MTGHEMRERLVDLFTGSMYVNRFSMGPSGSPSARLGVQLTHLPYIALSMTVITSVGTAPLDALGDRLPPALVQ